MADNPTVGVHVAAANIVDLTAADIVTDGTLAENSDVNVPSVKATKTYADGKVPLNTKLDFSALTPGSETSGSVMTTLTDWIDFTMAGACGIKLLLNNKCNTGEFATLRIRARANNTTGSGDGGNSVGTTTCADLSASANGHEFGNLKALNACAQPNDKNQTTDTSNVVTAIYGRIDATGNSVGRRWVGWLDTHATTKAANGDYMQRISHNGSIAIDGAFTVYSGGRLPVLFNFEDIAGFLSASTGGESFTKTHKIAVSIAGVGTRYIQAGTCA